MSKQGHLFRWPHNPRTGADPQKADCNQERAWTIYNLIKPEGTPVVTKHEFNMLLLIEGECGDVARQCMLLVLEGKASDFERMVRKNFGEEQ